MIIILFINVKYNSRSTYIYSVWGEDNRGVYDEGITLEVLADWAKLVDELRGDIDRWL